MAMPRAPLALDGASAEESSEVVDLTALPPG